MRIINYSFFLPFPKNFLIKNSIDVTTNGNNKTEKKGIPEKLNMNMQRAGFVRAL